MQRLPSQVPLPRRFTRPGIFFVSISSSLCKIPFLSRKPTTILGTPNRKDCIQNFRSLRSYFSMSLSLSISAEVFNSTQLMGSSLFSGLQSHTTLLTNGTQRLARVTRLTCVDFTANNQSCFPNPRPNDGAILSVIVHHHILATLDELSGSRIPLIRYQGQSLKFVTCK